MARKSDDVPPLKPILGLGRGRGYLSFLRKKDSEEKGTEKDLKDQPEEKNKKIEIPPFRFPTPSQSGQYDDAEDWDEEEMLGAVGGAPAPYDVPPRPPSPPRTPAPRPKNLPCPPSPRFRWTADKCVQVEMTTGPQKTVCVGTSTEDLTRTADASTQLRSRYVPLTPRPNLGMAHTQVSRDDWNGSRNEHVIVAREYEPALQDHGFPAGTSFFQRHSLLTPAQLHHLTSAEDVRTLDLRAAELSPQFRGRVRSAFRGVYEAVLNRFIRDYYLRREHANASATTWPH